MTEWEFQNSIKSVTMDTASKQRIWLDLQQTEVVPRRERARPRAIPLLAACCVLLALLITAPFWLDAVRPGVPQPLAGDDILATMPSDPPDKILTNTTETVAPEPEAAADINDGFYVNGVHYWLLHCTPPTEKDLGDWLYTVDRADGSDPALHGGEVYRIAGSKGLNRVILELNGSYSVYQFYSFTSDTYDILDDDMPFEEAMSALQEAQQDATAYFELYGVSGAEDIERIVLYRRKGSGTTFYPIAEFDDPAVLAEWYHHLSGLTASIDVYYEAMVNAYHNAGGQRPETFGDFKAISNSEYANWMFNNDYILKIVFLGNDYWRLDYNTNTGFLKDYAVNEEFASFLAPFLQ